MNGGQQQKQGNWGSRQPLPCLPGPRQEAGRLRVPRVRPQAGSSCLRAPGRLGCAAAGGCQASAPHPRGVLRFALQGSASAPGLRAWWAGTAPTTSSPSWWPSSRPARPTCAAPARPPGGAGSRPGTAPPRPRTCRGPPAPQVGQGRRLSSTPVGPGASVRTQDLQRVADAAQLLQAHAKP